MEWEIVFEILTAVLIFCLFPRKWLAFISVRFTLPEKGEKVEAWHRGIEINDFPLTELLADTAQILRGGVQQQKKTEIVEILRSSMERICYDCTNRDLCWMNHQDELLNFIVCLEKCVQDRGKVSRNDIPYWFSNYCPKVEMLLGEMNFELRNNTEKLIYENKFDEVKEGVCDLLERFSNIYIHSICSLPVIDKECRQTQEKIIDFCLMNQLECNVSVSRLEDSRLKIELQGKCASRLILSNRMLDELSDILDMRLRAMKAHHRDNTVYLYEAETYAVSVGAVVKKKNGESICGDYYSYLKTEDGCLYVILSDGLGAGEYARQQSSKVVQLIERFLIFNVRPLDAVHLINSIVSLYHINQWDYATIDLLCVDLYTGASELFKVGAAGSFLKTGANIVEMKKQTLCAGTVLSKEFDVYHQKFQMRSGDVLVMMSDGVIVDDPVYLKELVERESDSMKFLARSILLEAQQRNPLDDDQTVLTVRLDERL